MPIRSKGRVRSAPKESQAALSAGSMWFCSQNGMIAGSQMISKNRKMGKNQSQNGCIKSKTSEMKNLDGFELLPRESADSRNFCPCSPPEFFIRLTDKPTRLKEPAFLIIALIFRICVTMC